MLFVTCRLEEGYVVYDFSKRESYLLDEDKLSKYARHGQCINARGGVHTKLVFLSGCEFDNIVDKESLAGKQYVVCYVVDNLGNTLGIKLLMAKDALTWEEKIMRGGEVVCIHEQVRNFENIKISNCRIKASHGNFLRCTDIELRSTGVDRFRNRIMISLAIAGLGLLGGVVMYAITGGTPEIKHEKSGVIQEFESDTVLEVTPLSVVEELEIEEVAGMVGNMNDIKSYVIQADREGLLSVKDGAVYVENKKLGVIDATISNHRAICSLHCICSFDENLKGSSLIHDEMQLEYTVGLYGNTVYTLNLGGVEYKITSDSVKSGDELVYRKAAMNKSGYTIEKLVWHSELSIVEAAVMMEQASRNDSYIAKELLKAE